MERVTDIICCYYEVFVKKIVFEGWRRENFLATVTASDTIVCYDLAISGREKSPQGQPVEIFFER